MIALEAHPEGIVLRVRAAPGARRAGIAGEHQGQLKIAVTQPPEKGKANKALVAELAEALGVRKSQVVLLSGETSHDKRFLIRETSRAAIEKRLRELLGP